MSRARLLVLLALTALFAFAFALAMDAGRRGYMPLDHGIVFDGAWRVMCGQVPYRDFTTPNGLVPIYLQVPFFALLGTTWFAYVLHAAAANGCFVLLVFALLRRFGLARRWALLYAAASAVVFQPPIGVPYMEQASFLFTLAAIVAAAWAGVAQPASWRALSLWAVSAAALAAAWFSKQIPALAGLPIVLAIAACAPRAARGQAFATLAASAAGWVGLALLAAWLAGVDFGLAYEYGWRLPRAEGAFKLRFVGTPAKFVERLLFVLRQAELPSVWLLTATPVPALGAWVLARRARGESGLRTLGAWSLAAALAWTCLTFVAFTGNQWQNGVPWVFACLGLLHAGASSASGEGAGQGSRRRLAAAIGLVLAALAARDAWVFQRDVVLTRVVNDLEYSAEAAAAARPFLPDELAYLDWCLPGSYAIGPREFGELVAFLRASDDGFVLLGDVTILHALARKPPLEPCLWLHPGLTMPWPDDRAFADFDARWVAPFRDGRARWLVLQGEQTFTQRKLEHFPALAALVAERAPTERRFGALRLLDLGR